MIKHILVSILLLGLIGCGGGYFKASGVDPSGNPINIESEWKKKDEVK